MRDFERSPQAPYPIHYPRVSQFDPSQIPFPFSVKAERALKDLVRASI